MSADEQSVAFLHHHMDFSFADLMSDYIVLDIEWMEEYSGEDDGVRAVATLVDPTSTDEAANIICLFPPFFPNDTNKEQ